MVHIIIHCHIVTRKPCSTMQFDKLFQSQVTSQSQDQISITLENHDNNSDNCPLGWMGGHFPPSFLSFIFILFCTSFGIKQFLIIKKYPNAKYKTSLFY